MNVIGYNAEAYAQREKGYSSEPIRDTVWELIKGNIQGVVLDAGSGAGGWINRLKQNQSIERIISVDIVDDGASQIDGVEFHLADLSQSPLPCSDNQLDWIFALEVLEHLANPRNFIQEAYRCLKPGGKLMITTPNNESFRSKISFLFRGYFPAFCDHDYLSTGHITPILEIDLKRMAVEFEFAAIEITYCLPDRLPALAIEWQTFFPYLTGKPWSGTMFGLLTK